VIFSSRGFSREQAGKGTASAVPPWFWVAQRFSAAISFVFVSGFSR
jgi:hypothetical protein